MPCERVPSLPDRLLSVSNRAKEAISIISRDRDAWLFFLTLGVCFVASSLRSELIIGPPTLFTEDASWSGRLLRSQTLTYLNARPDYFVVGNLLLLHASILINSLLFGTSISELPWIISLLSISFYSLVSAIVVPALRHHVSIIGRVAIALMMTLVPLGSSSAEVFGRASNVGFSFAVLATLLTIWRGQSRRSRIFIDIGLVLCMLTNPISIAIIVVALAIQTRGNIIYDYRRNIFLYITIAAVSSAVAWRLSSILAVQQPPLSADGFFLVVIARALLYPFIFPWWKQPSALLLLVTLTALFCTFLAGLMHAKQKQGLIVLLTSLAVVAVSTWAQRRLLPQQLGWFWSSYPDRYFYAQNVLCIAAFIWSCDALARWGNAMWRTVSLTITLAILVTWSANRSIIFDVEPVSCPPARNFGEQLALGRPVVEQLSLTVVEVCPPGWYATFPAAYVEAWR